MTKPSKYNHPTDQQFDTFDDWVRRASLVLTQHPEHNNTEYHPRGALPGWQGHHFTALCFDQQGRRCRIGADFQRANEEDAFPVWWVWPDQIAERLTKADQRTETLIVKIDTENVRSIIREEMTRLGVEDTR